jgi:hypothetical protein
MKRIIICLIGFLHFNVFAGEVIGSWEVIIDKSDVQIAKTVNVEGAVSGVMCFKSSKSCSAYFVTVSNCEENARYPVLVNSSIGAATSPATCVKSGDKNIMVLDNFDDVVRSFEAGGEIGFALPLASGKFSVLRFNCSGATAAIRQARALPQNNKPTKNPAAQVL